MSENSEVRSCVYAVMTTDMRVVWMAMIVSSDPLRDARNQTQSIRRTHAGSTLWVKTKEVSS